MNRISDDTRDIWIAGLLFGLLWIWSDANILILIGAIYMIACYVFPLLKNLNHLFWTKLTMVLQSVFQPILFGLIYLIILVPLGLLFQIFRKKDAISNSSFMDINRKVDGQFFKEPW